MANIFMLYECFSTFMYMFMYITSRKLDFIYNNDYYTESPI
jgi:hypothetical protein